MLALIGRCALLQVAAAMAAGCVTPAGIESRPVATAITATARSMAEVPPAPVGGKVGTVTPARPGDTVWTIERGSYAGMTLVLRFDAALGPGRNAEHFWRLPPGSGKDGGVVGWNSERFPIPLAFRRGVSSGEFSSSDSTAFWAIIGEMTSDLGMAVFRPATVAAAADPDDVIIVDVRSMAATDGLSRTTWTPSGELFDVRVTFRDAGTLHDGHVVTHEMMHALGFGHGRCGYKKSLACRPPW